MCFASVTSKTVIKSHRQGHGFKDRNSWDILEIFFHSILHFPLLLSLPLHISPFIFLLFLFFLPGIHSGLEDINIIKRREKKCAKLQFMIMAGKVIYTFFFVLLNLHYCKILTGQQHLEKKERAASFEQLFFIKNVGIFLPSSRPPRSPHNFSLSLSRCVSYTLIFFPPFSSFPTVPAIPPQLLSSGYNFQSVLMEKMPAH